MVDVAIRPMTKDEQYAFKMGENDFNQGLSATPERHHFHNAELRDAYIRGHQMAIGGAEYDEG